MTVSLRRLSHAWFIFEVANLPAQRRLRNLQPRGSTRHVLFFDDSDEVSQVAEFHSPFSLPFRPCEPSRKNLNHG